MMMCEAGQANMPGNTRSPPHGDTRVNEEKTLAHPAKIVRSDHSQERMRVVAENVADIIVTNDVETGEVTYISPSYEQHFGFATDQVLGRRSLDLVHEDDRRRVTAAAKRALISGESGETIFRCQHCDGDWLWIESHFHVIGDTRRGERLEFHSTSHDISERKREQERLVESEAHYRLLADNASDLVSLTDLEGKLLYVSPNVREMLGFAPEELVGVNEIELVHHADRVAVGKQLGKDGRTRLRYRARRKDGGWMWVESLTRPIYGHDRFEANGFVSSTRDINDRVTDGEALKLRAAELERTNSELRAFAYAASHDLHEPLRVIRMSAEMIERAHHHALDEEAWGMLEQIGSSAERMSDLVDDLLRFASVDHIETRPGAGPVACDLAVDQAITDLSVAIKESGARIHRQPLPVLRAGNIGQITQVFQNLLANAIKFHGVDSPEIGIAAQRAGDHWEFEVSDNGIGVGPVDTESIFTVFHRLHGSKYPGSGIGLALTRKIIEAHGGRIAVRASDSIGTIFAFDLPA
jgi:PAS domain S-box-containing protein